MEYFNAEPSGSERKYIIVAKLDTILLEHLSHASNSQISIKFGKENVLNIDGQPFTFGSTPEDLIQECYLQEGATWMCVGDIKRKAMFQHQLTTEDRERVRVNSADAEKQRKSHIAKFIDNPSVKPGRARSTSKALKTVTPKKPRPSRTAVIPKNPKGTTIPLPSSTPVSQPIPPPGSGSNEKIKPSKPSPTSTSPTPQPPVSLGPSPPEKRTPLLLASATTIQSLSTSNGHSADSTPLVPRTKSVVLDKEANLIGYHSPEKKSPTAQQPQQPQHSTNTNTIQPVTTILPTTFDIESSSQPLAPPVNTKPVLTGKELRKNIIQVLAVQPMPPTKLQQMFPNMDTNILNQVATFATNSNMWHLRKMCWKEVELDWKDYTFVKSLIGITFAGNSRERKRRGITKRKFQNVSKKSERSHMITVQQPPPAPANVATLNHSNNNNNPETKPLNGLTAHPEPAADKTAKMIVKVKNPFKKLRQQNADKRKAEEISSEKTKIQKITQVAPPKPIETYVEFVQRKSEYEAKYSEYTTLRSEIGIEGNIQKIFLELGEKQKATSVADKETVEKEIKQLYADKSETMWRKHEIIHEELSMLKSLLRDAQPKFSQENGKL